MSQCRLDGIPSAALKCHCKGLTTNTARLQELHDVVNGRCAIFCGFGFSRFGQSDDYYERYARAESAHVILPHWFAAGLFFVLPLILMLRTRYRKMPSFQVVPMAQGVKTST